MTKCLAHRGPDDDGVWQDPEAPLLLGHTRLSIIDLSAEGAQPMVSASGRYMIVYNGEVYNFPALMAELEAQGVTFRGHSDTEVILAAVDSWGLNRTLPKLNGMFAFALWDRKSRQLHLVRDRLGKKPLYCGWAGDMLVFGSELKVFHAAPAFETRVNRDALALYLRYACVPAPYSIFENVWQLPAGMRLTIDADDIKPGDDLSLLLEPYWNLCRVVEEAKGRLSSKTENEVISEFDGLLSDAVKARMISDVPIGAFLSGGIDSSAVVALMQKNAASPVKTFSIGFEEQGFDEAGYAKDIAAHLGTDHHELYVTPQDALDVIPRLQDIYDEPFADASQIPTFMVSRHARSQVTVALSGDGGDELLGGYQRHFVVPDMLDRFEILPQSMRTLLANAMLAMPEAVLDKLRRDHPQFGSRVHKFAHLLALSGPDAVYRQLVSSWQNPESIVLRGTEGKVALTDPLWQPKGLGFAERMMYGDALAYLPNDVLVKVDRASMANSLETRAPLLDYRLFEYVWTLPVSMKLRDGKGKWLLRQVLSKYVPAHLYERPKQGFGVPVGQWLRGPLKDWAEDLLDEKTLQAESFFHSAPIRAAWDTHLKGHDNTHSHALWTLLMFQSWRRRWHAG